MLACRHLWQFSILGLAGSTGRHPSSCSLGAIVGPCVEGNRCAWSSFVNRVDDCLEEREPTGRQANAGSNNHAVIASRPQLTLHSWSGSFIRPDKAEVYLPSPLSHLLQRNRNTGVDLLGVHT